ncbi:glycoside hydrolase family 2 TIM barrel-domain containing protein [Mucilaginibacter lutimaris]|uniref:Glycoside hydrolase family 2 TIM barrel-domain containing protein n=1 Tax=Mucilaginibacter lutimaris TaxID=931629 RepID=A0ABW2ZBS1_9SPHI
MRSTLKLLFSSLFLLLIHAASFAQSVNLNWKLFPQDDIRFKLKQIAAPGFKTNTWINAIVPGTVFYSYVKAGREKNPDYADNIYKVDKAKYNKPYWYRAEFSAAAFKPGKTVWLKFNGIHKRGELYINGEHIGTVKGIVERGIYNITKNLNKKAPNVILVLVVPPRNDPEHNHPMANWEAPTYISSGSWDWMPEIPGLNSGLTDTVSLTTTGPVAVSDPWIRTQMKNLNAADVSLKVSLNNTSAKPVTGSVKFVISPGNILVNGPQITLKANSNETVSYDKEQFAQLHIKNPKLWWPNGYGGKPDGTQNIYTCKVSFEVAGMGVSDKVIKTFGIRKISSDTTSVNGPLRVYVNNVPILLKGGNWGMSDYMLKVRGKDYDTRIRFHQDMNFNIIRNWTGEVTDEAFYNYCDKYGIMVWDDFWLNNFGQIDSLGIFKSNAIEKVKKYRHHPSIVIWCGANEGVPGGDPNGVLNNTIKAAVKDNDADDRLYLARSNAGETNPNFSIHGGSKMLSGSGIWSNVDPRTYFTDPHNSYLFSKDSYGMRSELGTATFVNAESFKKFMPKEYWVAPTPEAVNSKTNMWAKHYFSTDGALGGGSDPVKYINTISNSYGKAISLEDFTKKAQMLNVETMKAMFEAWNDHMWKDATGMLIWMSQSACPSMIWQTYDYYYDLTGAYFGAKTACEPLHIQWNAATNSVKVINNYPHDINGLTAEAKVYNINGQVVSGYTQTKKLDVKSTSLAEAFVAFSDDKLPKLSDIHFLRLKLYDAKGNIVSENFYWIGNTYLDYTALNRMPVVGKSLQVSKPKISLAKNGVNKLLTYKITNHSKITAAFGIRAQMLNNKGEQILPALYSDGYFSLMQGETKTLVVEVDPKLLGKRYSLQVKAYNN